MSQHAHQLDHIVLLLSMLYMLLNVLLHEEHRSAGWFKVSCELFILKMKLLKPLTLLGHFHVAPSSLEHVAALAAKVHPPTQIVVTGG